MSTGVFQETRYSGAKVSLSSRTDVKTILVKEDQEQAWEHARTEIHIWAPVKDRLWMIRNSTQRLERKTMRVFEGEEPFWKVNTCETTESI